MFIFVLAIIFGFCCDMADLLDEHGLKWFKGADILFGILWGMSGLSIMVLYPLASIFLVGVVIYWIIMGKIDYLNHQLGSAIILSFGLWQIYKGILNIYLAILYTGVCLFVAFINLQIKKKNIKIPLPRLRHFIPALILGAIIGNFVFSIINLVTLVGWQISDFWFVWFEKNQNSPLFKKLGFRILRL